MQKITVTGFKNDALTESVKYSFPHLAKMKFPAELPIIDIFWYENDERQNGRVEYIVDTPTLDGRFNLDYFEYDTKDLINWQPLCDKIDEILGVSGTKIEWPKGQKKPNIITPKLNIGVFSELIKEYSVEFFNFSFNYENKKYFWCTIYLSYEHYNGGSNGMKLMDACFNAKNCVNSWWIETSKENYLKYNAEK